MKEYNYIGWLIAIGLLIYIFVSQQHCGRSHQQADTIIHVEYVYDTNTYTPSINTPKPIASIKRLPTLAADSGKPFTIDTAAIISAFFTAHYYEQVIEDSNLIATIADTVFNNEITHRSFSYRLLRPTAINTTTIIKQPEARNNWYLGFGSTVGVLQSSPTVGPEILITQPKHAYRIGYHFPGTVQASVFFKIK